MKLEHKVIDPEECPRCGSHKTQSLGDDGTPTETHICQKCEMKNPDGGACYYDVCHAETVESVMWNGEEDETLEVYSTDYIVSRAAKDLQKACEAARQLLRDIACELVDRDGRIIETDALEIILETALAKADGEEL